MLSKCVGSGTNPFTVNVITFSGHGFTFNGDSIAVIPQSPKDSPKEARFLNLSGLARKFAAKKYTFTLIIASMCRTIYTFD
jgi:hypothetical protein